MPREKPKPRPSGGVRTTRPGTEYDFAAQTLKTEPGGSMATLTDQQRAAIAAARARTQEVRNAGPMSGAGSAGAWNFQNGQMNVGGMNYGRLGEIYRSAVSSGRFTGNFQDFIRDFGADAQQNNGAMRGTPPQTQSGLLGPNPTEPQQPIGAPPGGLLGPGPGLDNGMGPQFPGQGPPPGAGLPMSGMPPGLPMTGSPAFPTIGSPIQPGNLGDPNMGPFPPGMQPPGGDPNAPGRLPIPPNLPTPGAGTPPGSYPNTPGLPVGGQQPGMPVPGNIDPGVLAAYGYMRGPNGEIMPMMLRQGMNPYQQPMPQGGLLGGGNYGLPPSGGGGGGLLG